MPDVPDAQGATITFRGRELGILTGFSPAFAVANVAEMTSVRSPVVGTGQNARVVKQYSATSIEPGTVTMRFIGAADLARDDCGYAGSLVISWSGGELTGNAFLEQLDADWTRGELRQWSATFRFTGF